MSSGRLARVLAVAACVAAFATGAEAATILFDVNVNLAGPSVSGDPTVATLKFEDVGANQVQLTVASSLNATSEFIGELSFNVLGGFTPSALTASAVSGSQVGQFTLPSLARGLQNAQDPNGIGGNGPGNGFDFNFVFKTSNKQQGAERFNLGDSFKYLFTATGLDATDFEVANAAGHFAYAHVQGIGPNDGSAGYVDNVQGPPPTGIPEPATIGLLLFGGSVLVARQRRRVSRS